MNETSQQPEQIGHPSVATDGSRVVPAGQQPVAEGKRLRMMFVITSMPVGGAETLLVNLIRRIDRTRFEPELCCLKEQGPLGKELADEIQVHSNLLTGKFDLRVLPRLIGLMRRRRIDAVITVGAGDKMFWGRLAARMARVPVVASALHSTGWPDGITRLNRLLTPLTDAFIGVATPHGRHLVEKEGLPVHKVHVIANGVDVQRFQRCDTSRQRLRDQLGIPQQAPVMGIVAALRPEKNHELFLGAAAQLLKSSPQAHFVLVGDGPRRRALERICDHRNLKQSVHFLGTRADIPNVLSMMDVFTLTSHTEANPVSILEAMSIGLPVVATDVGSVSESVRTGTTGLLVAPGNMEQIVSSWQELIADPARATSMGQAGRDLLVQTWSLERMVVGYQNLVQQIYAQKRTDRPANGAQTGWFATRPSVS